MSLESNPNIQVKPKRINGIKLEWFTTQDAALYLGVSKEVVLNLASSGQLNYFKFGSRNRYRKEDLDYLIVKKTWSVYGDKI